METDFQKFLDELRARVSVAEVVGAKVKLVRKGREYMGLCPFHNEKTPSFTVNEAKGFYHCFGCGAHGDIIKFEMEANGLPFMDAVTKLANKAGLRVPQIHGTALTEEQIAEAWKICPEPTLCFDGDNAGIHAAIRSIDRALPILKAGYSLKYVFLPDGMDPDEFLKAKGADEYEKALENTVPLADLLWRKNVEAVAADTPEQKALFEKTLLEEVAKIADEKVRGYYLQDMKNRIYERFRRPAREERTERNTDYRRSADGSGRKKNDKTAKAVARPQPVRITLDELVGKFIAAAMFCYPCLIGEYEEKAGMFEIKDSGLKLLLEKMAEVYHRDEPADSGALYTALKEEEASGYVDRLWEVKMLRQQNPDLRKLRHDIDNKILEMQLRQLENEIKECLREIETAESFPNETYRRYEMLKKERETLLAEQQADPSL